MQMTYGSGSSSGSGGVETTVISVGSGGSGSLGFFINGLLEEETRRVAMAMEGIIPTNWEWDIFFMRTDGGMSIAKNGGEIKLR